MYSHRILQPANPIRKIIWTLCLLACEIMAYCFGNSKEVFLLTLAFENIEEKIVYREVV